MAGEVENKFLSNDFIYGRGSGVDEHISQIILDFIATILISPKVRGILWLVEGENMKTHCGSSALDDYLTYNFRFEIETMKCWEDSAIQHSIL